LDLSTSRYISLGLPGRGRRGRRNSTGGVNRVEGGGAWTSTHSRLGQKICPGLNASKKVTVSNLVCSYTAQNSNVLLLRFYYYFVSIRKEVITHCSVRSLFENHRCFTGKNPETAYVKSLRNQARQKIRKISAFHLLQSGPSVRTCRERVREFSHHTSSRSSFNTSVRKKGRK
jgi:hypothetical protein